jgi:hypothetical protein
MQEAERRVAEPGEGLIAKNSPGRVKVVAPQLIIKGEADKLIPPSMTREFVVERCIRFVSSLSHRPRPTDVSGRRTCTRISPDLKNEDSCPPSPRSGPPTVDVTGYYDFTAARPPRLLLR